MPEFLRKSVFLVFCIAILLITRNSEAQVCPGFPTFLGAGSNKDVNKVCSPVSATVYYNVSYASPTPVGGVLEVEYNWDHDGLIERFVLPNGQSSYNHSTTHVFPTNSDCEFNVVINLRYNGVSCAVTRQVQKIASWRTDEYNGGNVQLISPQTGTNVHEVCRGVDVSVIFEDRTIFNCNENYVHAPGPQPINSPNSSNRWQQIIYNTPIGGDKIPNISVNGVPVTNGAGGNIIADYLDPRTANGIHYMPAEVQNNTQRRNALVITAPGGFGAGFPKLNDEFEVTIRYWNECNPYDDPLIPGPPANLINGDHPPVERTAIIRIVDAPNGPTPSTQTVCNGTTPNNFTVSGVPGGFRVNWYRDNAGTPGALIPASTTNTLPITTAGTGYTNNTTAGTYTVWASVQPTAAGGLNCESPKVAVTRTIRNQLTVPDPSSMLTEVCNGEPVTITMPAPANAAFGGTTQYTWTGSSGVVLNALTVTATQATFNTNVTFGAGQLFVDRTITVGREFTTTPNCTQTRNFTVRIWRPTVGGTPTPTPDICETSPVGTIALTGYIGTVLTWQRNFNNGGWVDIAGSAGATSISPGVVAAGTYRFRAVVKNGTCNTVFSAEEEVAVSANPGLSANAGPDQDFCGPLTSNPFGASNPAPGTGTWSFVSALSNPTTLPAPSISNLNDPNATISILAANAGRYVMRWTVANGLCSSFDDVVVDFGADPTDPNAGPDANICTPTYTMAANTPNVGFAEWVIVSGPGGCVTGNCSQLTIANVLSPTTQISLGATPIYGTYILKWTVTSGGAACFYEEDEVEIIFDEPVQIVSAPDVNGGCIDRTLLTPINVSATIGGGGVSGFWEVVTGDGSVNGTPILGVNINDAYTPTLLDYSAGNPFIVKITASPAATSSCPSVSKDVVISMDRRPVAVAGTNIGDICSDQVQLTAENPPPYGATGVWTSTNPAIIFNPADDPTSLATGLPIGNTDVTWTLTSASGNCVSQPSTITLTRVTLPNATNYTTYQCQLGPVAGATTVTLLNFENDVTNLPAADRQISWSRNGVPIGNASTPILNVAHNTVFLARIRDNATNCISEANLIVSVRSLPTATNSSMALCEDPNHVGEVRNVDLNQPQFINQVTGGAAGLEVVWYNDILDAQAEVNPITDPFDFAIAMVSRYARVTYQNPTPTAPACPTFAELKLIRNELPRNLDIIGRGSVCKGDGSNNQELPIEVYQISAPQNGYKYYWDIPTAAGEFQQKGGGGESDFFVLLQFPNIPSPNSLSIKVRVEANICSSETLELPILVSEVPVKPVISAVNKVCENQDGVNFEIINSNYPLSTYSWRIYKQSDNLEGGAFIVSGQGSDDIFVRFTNENVYLAVKEENTICVSDTTRRYVQVNRRPILLDNDLSICSDGITNVEFQPAIGSVAINKYNITNVNAQAGLGFITPVGGMVDAYGVPSTAIQNHRFKNQTAVPLNVNYTVQPVSVDGALECVGSSQILTVTVKPLPQLNKTLGKNLCSEEPTNVRLVSAPNTFPADRFVILNPIAMGPDSIAAADPVMLLVADGTTLHNDDVIFNHSYINTAGNNRTVTYRVNPYSTLLQCYGDTVNLPIVVHPRTLIEADANPVYICSGAPININFSSPNNKDATFQWMVKSFDSKVILGTAATGVGNISNMIATNNSMAAMNDFGTMVIGIRAKNINSEETTAGCVNPEEEVIVEVRNPPRGGNLVPNASVCSELPSLTTARVDLTTHIPAVVTDHLDPNISLSWLTSTNAAIDPTTLTSYNITNADPVRIRVLNTATTCQNEFLIQYNVNPNVSFTAPAIVPLKCFGDANGQIPITVTTGTSSYSYAIRKLPNPFGPFTTTPAANFTFTNRDQGMYEVEVRDLKGCFANQQVEIQQPDKLLIAIDDQDNPKCFLGTDGFIEPSATGGTPMYTFELLGKPTPLVGGRFSNLGDGIYTVQVTDANGCIDQTIPPVLLQSPTQVEVKNIVASQHGNFNLSCSNVHDGEVNFNVQGGTTPYDSYILNRNGVLYRTGLASDGTFFNAMEAGTYTIAAKDANGCLSQPGVVALVAPPPFNAGIIGSNQNVCDKTAPQLLTQLAPAFGGIGNYQYEWQMSTTGNLNDYQTIVGASGSTYQPPVLNFSQVTSNTRYYKRVVTSGGCAPGESVVQITIRPLPKVSAVGATLCQGSGGDVKLQIVPGTGQDPFTFTYEDATGVYPQTVRGGYDISIPVNNVQQPHVVKFSDIVDAYFCKADDPASVDAPVDVVKISSVFTATEVEACSGEASQISWNADADLGYELHYGDGGKSIFPPGQLPSAVFTTAPRPYNNNSTTTTATFPVRLIATSFAGCKDTTTVHLKRFPMMELSLTPENTALCSGELLKVTNNSRGVQSGTWYVEDNGGVRTLISSGPVAPFQYQVTNNDFNQNAKPVRFVYEVVNSFGANNHQCFDDEVVDVFVYPKPTANFSITNTPEFRGGDAQVDILDQSLPFNHPDFSYQWDFDDKDWVEIYNSGNVRKILYNSPDPREITLTITNTALLRCNHSLTLPVNITVPELSAEFEATPLAACLPATITTRNKSGKADSWVWNLIGDGINETSTLKNPQWTISKPGVYRITLEAYVAGNGIERKFAEPVTVQVLSIPSAVFELLTTQVYIPGTEVRIINKSTGANAYSWNFGDHPESENKIEINPTYQYRDEGKYPITLTAKFNHSFDFNNDGIVDTTFACVDKTVRQIIAKAGGSLKIPNAFTPNTNGPNAGGVPGDGRNDIFLPIMDGVEEFTMHIFDRWGTLIFESRDKNEGWNGYDRSGRLMPAGVYVYKLVLRLGDNSRTTQVGDVTLIR